MPQTTGEELSDGECASVRSQDASEGARSDSFVVETGYLSEGEGVVSQAGEEEDEGMEADSAGADRGRIVCVCVCVCIGVFEWQL